MADIASTQALVARVHARLGYGHEAGARATGDTEAPTAAPLPGPAAGQAPAPTGTGQPAADASVAAAGVQPAAGEATFPWDDETRQAFLAVGTDPQALARFEAEGPSEAEVLATYLELEAQATGTTTAAVADPAAADPTGSADPTAPGGPLHPDYEPGEPAWSLAWADRFRSEGIGEDIIQQLHLSGGQAMDEAQLEAFLGQVIGQYDQFIAETLGGTSVWDDLDKWLDRGQLFELANHRFLFPEIDDVELLRMGIENRSMENMTSTPAPVGWVRMPGMPLPGPDTMAKLSIPYMTVPGYGFLSWMIGKEPGYDEPIYKDPRVLGGMMGFVPAFLAWNGAVQVAAVGRNANIVRGNLAMLASATGEGRQGAAALDSVAKVARARGIDQLRGIKRLAAYVPHTETNKAVSSLHHVRNLRQAIDGGRLSGEMLTRARGILALAETGAIRVNSHSFWMPGALAGLNHHNRGMIFGRDSAQVGWRLGKGGVSELTISSGVGRHASVPHMIASTHHLEALRPGEHVANRFTQFESQTVRRTPTMVREQGRLLAQSAEQLGVGQQLGHHNTVLGRIQHVVRPTATTDVAEALRSMRAEQAGRSAETLYRSGGIKSFWRNGVVGPVATSPTVHARLGAMGLKNPAGFVSGGFRAAGLAAVVSGAVILGQRVLVPKLMVEPQLKALEQQVDTEVRHQLLETGGVEALGAYAERRGAGGSIEIDDDLRAVLEEHGLPVGLFVDGDEADGAVPSAAGSDAGASAESGTEGDAPAASGTEGETYAGGLPVGVEIPAAPGE